jgi:gliding motility-associated-like protein
MRYFIQSLLFLSIVCATWRASAANLIQNGTFNASGASWVTSCTAVEAYAFETTYGGSVATNRVAEVDDESCFHQDVCVLPGASYIYSMDASVRTAGGPNPVTSHIRIDGLDATGTVVGTYVDMDYVRNNTTFALTAVTGIPVINVPSGMGVVRLRITLTDNTAGFSTLGMIVDNLSLTEAAPPGIVGADTTCPAVAHTFSVTGVGTTGIYYSWNFGAFATPATSASATPLVSWSTAGVYIATVTLGNGVCMVDTVAYTIHVTSSVAATLFDTTCYNVGYHFGGNTLYSSGTYTDSFVSAGGCDSIITLHLYIRPLPYGHLYDTICSGSTYTYYGHVYTTTGNYYSDTLHTLAGCDSITILHLQVNTRPAPPSVASPVYCQFAATAPLSASGSSLTWYGPGVTAGYTTPPAVSSSVPVIDTYYVTQSVNGCASDSARAIVTIVAQPLPPVVRDTAYCQYSTAVSLSATGAGLQWYTVPAGGIPVTVPPLPSTTVAGTFIWYVSQVVNGCESNRAADTVNILSSPVFHIAASRSAICQHDTVSLYYSGTPFAGNYSWSLPAGETVVSGGINTPALVVRADSAWSQAIALYVAAPDGSCSASDTFRLLVQPAPLANAFINDNVCLYDTVVLGLQYHSGNAATYVWNYGGAAIITAASGGGGPYTLRFDTAGIRVLSLTPYTTEGCRGETTYDTVHIRSLPVVAINVLEGNVQCLDDSVQLAVAQPDAAVSYRWLPAHFFNGGNSAVQWATIDKAGYVSVTAVDPFGCYAADSVLFTPQSCCQVYFPGAFTPNGDGKNDLFRPLYAGYHRLHNFRIENRWGQTVFESANSQMGWDGKFNGVPQDMDVYFYFIKYDCGGATIVEKGDVTLVR